MCESGYFKQRNDLVHFHVFTVQHFPNFCTSLYSRIPKRFTGFS